MAQNELIITIGILFLVLLLFLAKQLMAYAMVVLGLVIITAYFASKYHGVNNWKFPALSLGIFVIFIASSYIDKSLANILLVAWVISCIYFAYNSRAIENSRVDSLKDVRKDEVDSDITGEPISILKARLARGEISDEEFERKLNLLKID